jgi:hypothetical protein
MREINRLLWLVCTAFALLNTATSQAREYEGSRADSVLLNGVWEFAVGAGDDGAQTAAGQHQVGWQAVKLPGPFMSWTKGAPNQTKVVWARRSFNVSAAQAQRLAVLRWNRIACGAAAFINGQTIGENQPTGPFQVIVPAGVLKPGDNQIVLKIRVTPAGPQPADDLTVLAQVNSWPEGKFTGEGRAPARLVPSADPLGGEHFFVEVPMPDFQPWTPPFPVLTSQPRTLHPQPSTCTHTNFF